MTTERDERELRQIGRRVADALEPWAGRAVPAARRRLFEGERHAAGAGTRWIIALAAVGALSALAVALRTDPAGTMPARGPAAADGRAHDASDRVVPPSTTRGIEATEGSRARTERRADGATELVLESGEARGVVGPRATGPRGTGPRAIVAGPYRITGDADLTVTWSDAASAEGGGLTVRVRRGEARILAPGRTPVVVSEGATKALPAAP